MNNINKYPIIQSCYICDRREFIQFWSTCYNYKLEDLYKTRINLQQFTQTDIEKLFEWKNGIEWAEEDFVKKECDRQTCFDKYL